MNNNIIQKRLAFVREQSGTALAHFQQSEIRARARRLLSADIVAKVPNCRTLPLAVSLSLIEASRVPRFPGCDGSLGYVETNYPSLSNAW
jgi:hypothetical protein